MKIDGLVPKDKTELQQRKRQQTEFKLIGSMRHRTGLTLFSGNVKTGEVKPAEYVKERILEWNDAIRYIKNGSVKRKVQIEKDCVYFEALNLENAKKKFEKGKGVRN